jgi:hypothetical protein
MMKLRSDHCMNNMRYALYDLLLEGLHIRVILTKVLASPPKPRYAPKNDRWEKGSQIFIKKYTPPRHPMSGLLFNFC